MLSVPCLPRLPRRLSELPWGHFRLTPAVIADLQRLLLLSSDVLPLRRVMRSVLRRARWEATMDEVASAGAGDGARTLAGETLLLLLRLLLDSDAARVFIITHCFLFLLLDC